DLAGPLRRAHGDVEREAAQAGVDDVEHGCCRCGCGGRGRDGQGHEGGHEAVHPDRTLGVGHAPCRATPRAEAAPPAPTPPSWTRFLHASLVAQHGATVYGSEAELADPVGAYLATGFDLSEPALVVATPDHHEAFAARLGACGWDAAELVRSGRLRRADAATMLEGVLEEGRPTPGRFEEVIGGAIDEVASRFPGRQLRVFGEMVDLLCVRGDGLAAAELESLWNRLALRRRFSLLCGYRRGLFLSEPSLLDQVCDAHTHVHADGQPATA